MKEKDLNTIINNSFKTLGAFSHKIADPLGGTGIQNPFDGFSVWNSVTYFWETKFQKDYKAFNFNRIEEHQHNSLNLINKQGCKNTKTVIILGIWKSRDFFHVYFFDYDSIKGLKDTGKKSLLKKELESLKEQEKYLEIKKKQILGLENIQENILYLGDLNGTNIAGERSRK